MGTKVKRLLFWFQEVLPLSVPNASFSTGSLTPHSWEHSTGPYRMLRQKGRDERNRQRTLQSSLDPYVRVRGDPDINRPPSPRNKTEGVNTLTSDPGSWC